MCLFKLFPFCKQKALFNWMRKHCLKQDGQTNMATYGIFLNFALKVAWISSGKWCILFVFDAVFSVASKTRLLSCVRMPDGAFLRRCFAAHLHDINFLQYEILFYSTRWSFAWSYGDWVRVVHDLGAQQIFFFLPRFQMKPVYCGFAFPKGCSTALSALSLAPGTYSGNPVWSRYSYWIKKALSANNP